MTILDKIIAHKRREVAALREKFPYKTLEKTAYFEMPRKPFVLEINRPDKVGIIAEFKRRSPSKGAINAEANIEEIARGYEIAGASALSVLTDAEFFGGSNRDLTEAFRAIEMPILRKDFIIDEPQIVEARSIGASAILLIAAVLDAKEIKRLAAFAKLQELEVLLEVHDENEIPADLTNISAIGVNNRNLKDFSVDVNRSISIAEKLPAEITKVSESGLKDAATILELKKAGFRGFLIGETFMKTENPAAACAKLVKEVQNSKFKVQT